MPVRASVGTVLSAVLSPSPGLAVGTAVNGAVFAAGLPVLLRGLTPAGVAHAAILGTLVYSAFGPGGYLLVCLYFLVGSAVTKLRLAQKQAEGIAEARSGRRSPASVWGSGAAAAACAVAALCGCPPHAWLWRMAFVASLASKLGDTTSSEVGKAYGRTTYLVTTLQRVPRGTEGAVSAEGTLAGIAAAAAMASAALAAAQVRAPPVRCCCLVLLRCALKRRVQVDVAGWTTVVIAAFIANTAESFVGATLQGRVSWLTNDVVNILQITLAAAIALLLRMMLT